MSVLLLAVAFFFECENFDRLGGWVVETQSMQQLGSSYLMAHGAGVPVDDAVGTVEIAVAGEYTVWTRTRDWLAEWKPNMSPGRFRVRIDGRELATDLGTNGRDWSWQKAGIVTLAAGQHTLALHDLTGFNGRCDKLCLTTEDAFPPPEPPLPVVTATNEYDFVVVGGGIAGSCAALAASRLGVKTLLLQDRAMLGGCNSSEVRVGLGGRTGCGPYPALGRVVREIQPLFGAGTPLSAESYEDARKMQAFNLKRLYSGKVPGAEVDVKTGEYVTDVETNAAGRVTAVISQNVRTGVRTRWRAPLLCDATGDAVLARKLGCETMYGREERSRWREPSAPEKADRQVMGLSVQWTSCEETTVQSFPDISAWALPFDAETANYRTHGSWEQEFGQYRDMADDAEKIRDYGLWAIFSNWHFVKNVSARKDEFSRVRFDWISPTGGKRESYRVVGDHVLTQNDLEQHLDYPDATAAVTWATDFHFPDPALEGRFPEPVRSAAYHRGFGDDYPVPYRCLYARDCPNLLLAGRHISCSHAAFAAVRVMRTLGMLGEVVGMAASICVKEKTTPRGVYEKHLNLLKELMKKGVPPLPEFHGYRTGLDESFDFNYRGWARTYPGGRPLTDAQQKDIRATGYELRNPPPEFQDRRRRLVLADESRARLHYYDSQSVAAGFSVDVKKPVWDLKRLGETTYRTVCHGGYQVTDLAKGKIIEEFRYPDFKDWMATAVCDLKDGGFVFSVNPRGADARKAIHFYDFGPDRKLRRILKLPGFFNARSMSPGRDGEWLIAHEKGFARIRLPDSGETVELVKNYPQPAGRNLFAVIPTRTGDGYLAGCGYGGGLVRFDAAGEATSTWFVPTDKGKESRFYGQVEERADGNVYLAHWTGHGEKDSFKGVQVAEFDPTGKMIWTLDSPDRFGSISGVIVLGEEEVK